MESNDLAELVAGIKQLEKELLEIQRKNEQTFMALHALIIKLKAEKYGLGK